MGTLVKLVRVLMLGPVCLVLSVVAPKFPAKAKPATATVTCEPESRRQLLSRLVPWFIAGFLVLAVCRSLGLVPDPAVAPLGKLSTLLTVASMAALGLGVDVRTVAKAGGSVAAAAMLSLALLGGISFVLVRLLRLG